VDSSSSSSSAAGEALALRPAALGGLALDLVLVAIVVAARFAFAIAPLDDAFLLLAVVRNALAGGGPHLLAGGGDAALSTLAWPALVALPAAAGLDLVRSLAALGLAAEVALVLVARRWLERLTGSRSAAALGAAALATEPVFLLASLGGMETPLVVLLLTLAAWGILAGRAWVAALAAACLSWARVEGLLAAAVLLALVALDGRRRGAPVRLAVVAGAALALGAPLAHRLVVGDWLPATVAAKAAVGGGATLAGAAAVALEMAKAPLGLSAYWLVTPSVHAALVPLALAGAWRAVRDRALGRRLRPAVLPALAHAALFVAAARGYAVNFPWYFAPPLVAVVALAAAGGAPGLERWLARAPRLRAAAPALVALVFALAAAPSLDRDLGRVRASFSAHRERAYAAATLWLTGAGHARSLAGNEVGALAFFSPPGTTIVDLFGIARAPADRGRPFLELVEQRAPEAIVNRIDFRYRRAIEAALPGRYTWVRFGSLDLGLAPDLARRLEPRQDELPRLYSTLDLSRAPERP
jgi:hypothetical protein